MTNVPFTGCEKHSRERQPGCRACEYITDLECCQGVLYEAVKYCLDRTQTNADFGYYAGPGMEAFRKLCLAEAAFKQVELAAVEAERGKQFWKEEPLVLDLQKDLEIIREGIVSDPDGRVEELECELDVVREERDDYAQALDEFSAILDGKSIEHHVEATAELCDGKGHNSVVFALAHLKDDFQKKREQRIRAEEGVNKLDKKRLDMLRIAGTRLYWSRRWKRLAKKYAARFRRAIVQKNSPS